MRNVHKLWKIFANFYEIKNVKNINGKRKIDIKGGNVVLKDKRKGNDEKKEKMREKIKNHVEKKGMGRPNGGQSAREGYAVGFYRVK